MERLFWVAILLWSFGLHWYTNEPPINSAEMSMFAVLALMIIHHGEKHGN